MKHDKNLDDYKSFEGFNRDSDFNRESDDSDSQFGLFGGNGSNARQARKAEQARERRGTGGVRSDKGDLGKKSKSGLDSGNPKSKFRDGATYLISWNEMQLPAQLLQHGNNIFEFRELATGSSVFIENEDQIIIDFAKLAGMPPRRDPPKGKGGTGMGGQGLDLGETPVIYQGDEGGVVAVVSPQMIAAYRDDLKLENTFLQEAEGQLAAQQLGVQAHVMSQVFGPVIQANNIQYGDNGDEGILLHLGNHYIVLERTDGFGFDYVDLDGNGYRVRGKTVEDGNCLLDGLHIIEADANGTPKEFANLRAEISTTLDDGAIRQILIAMIMTVVHGGNPGGVGSRVWAFLRGDQQLHGLHEQAQKRARSGLSGANKDPRELGNKAGKESSSRQEQDGGSSKQKHKPKRKRSLSPPSKSGGDGDSDDGSLVGLKEGDLVRFTTGHGQLGQIPYNGEVLETRDGEEGIEYRVDATGQTSQLCDHEKDEWLPAAQVLRDDARMKRVGNQGKRYKRSTATDPEIEELLPFGGEMSEDSELLLANPFVFPHLMLSGGIHGLDAFNEGAKKWGGLDMDQPGSKTRKTAVSATNSFSSVFVKNRLLGEQRMLALKPGDPDLMLGDDSSQGVFQLPKEKTEQSLTGLFDQHVRQQAKISKRSRKNAFEERGVLDSSSAAPKMTPSRSIFHTEAQWYHSKQFQQFAFQTIEEIKCLIDLVAWQDPEDALSESWDKDMPGWARLVMPLIQKTMTTLINRSSCTSKSGYGGGCAQESAETVEAFWKLCAARLGNQTTFMLRTMGNVSFKSSFAGRDTNAGDKTVETPMKHGIDLSVHPKLDVNGGKPQPFDANQLAAMKLIRQQKSCDPIFTKLSGVHNGLFQTISTLLRRRDVAVRVPQTLLVIGKLLLGVLHRQDPRLAAGARSAMAAAVKKAPPPPSLAVQQWLVVHVARELVLPFLRIQAQAQQRLKDEKLSRDKLSNNSKPSEDGSGS